MLLAMDMGTVFCCMVTKRGAPAAPAGVSFVITAGWSDALSALAWSVLQNVSFYLVMGNKVIKENNLA